MIDKMTKYSFILLSGKSEEFLSGLQGLGLVDITRSSKPVDEKSAALLAESNELRKAVSTLKGFDCSKDPEIERITVAIDPDMKVDDPMACFRETSARLVALQAELDQARKDVESARAWGSYDRKALEAISSLGYKVRYYCISKKKYDPSWASIYPLQEVADNGKTVWFVTVSDDPEYNLPVAESPIPTEDLGSAERKVARIKDEQILCKARMLSLKEYAPEMERQSEGKASELQLYLAQAGSGKVADDLVTTFVGFAPTDCDAQLCAEFDRMDVIYVKEDAVKDDNPPIKMKGNWFTRMFTVLTDMYGRPVYDEFDPTPYISIFFTLFFAMCMGDAGYGLMLLILGIGMKKMLGDLAPLVTTLGGATLIMGIVLHTFFGMDISTAAWVPAGLKKCMITGSIAGYDAQMLFSILIGVIHLCIAMLLKAIYSVRKSGFMASLGTLGWTLLIVGGVIVGGFALLGVIGATATKWTVIVLGAISALGIFLFNDIHRNPLINIGSGLYETYNTVTGLLGDVLSYLRLYALGLAGGMLGNAFNSLGTTLLGIEVPGLNIIGCVLILVFGHVLNLAMCCLGAFVHPLRLNFLEFFKNSGYEGAGRVYNPLKTNLSE